MTTAISPGPRTVDIRSSGRSLLKPLGLVAFIGAVGYFVLGPLVRLQSKAFADGAAGYRTAFTADRIGRTIAYTIGLALGSLTIALVLGTLLAWAATRLPPKLRILRVVPVLPIVVPAIASVVGWAFLLSPRPGYLNAALRTLPWWSDLEEGPIDIYTMPFIVIITGIGLTAFVYLFVAAGFESINSEHLEAAQVAGSSQLGVFFRVTLPLLRPTLLYGGGVALLLGLGQFTGPLLLGRTAGIDVVTTSIYADMSQTPVQYGSAAALGSTLLVFGVIVVAMQKALLRDRKRFVTHGGKAFRSPGRPSKLAAVALVGYTFIATVLPVSAILVVSLSKFWSADIDVAGFTLDNFRQIFDQSNVTDAVYNSVTISLIAMAISLPLGFVAASIINSGKGYGPLRAVADFLVAIPLGVPALLFGAGFLLTYTEGPFVLYGTRWVIVLVYVTLMLPFATRMQLSALVSLGEGYVEAARVSGSSVIGANLKVVLPLMRAALGGAAALIFVLLTHEFAASVLVRSSTTQVMGTVLYDYWSNGSLPPRRRHRPRHVVRHPRRRRDRRAARRQQSTQQPLNTMSIDRWVPEMTQERAELTRQAAPRWSTLAPDGEARQGRHPHRLGQRPDPPPEDVGDSGPRHHPRHHPRRATARRPAAVRSDHARPLRRQPRVAARSPTAARGARPRRHPAWAARRAVGVHRGSRQPRTSLDALLPPRRCHLPRTVGGLDPRRDDPRRTGRRQSRRRRPHGRDGALPRRRRPGRPTTTRPSCTITSPSTPPWPPWRRTGSSRSPCRRWARSSATTS